MAQFTLKFLGQFEVKVDIIQVTDFHSNKARALLAYLALEPRDHARTTLATLLWPEIDDKYARTNLRTTLYRLRQTLDGAAPGAGDRLLTVTRQTVHFNTENCIVDALRFQVLLGQEALATPQTVDQLVEAVALYQGELLMGFGVDDAAPFEEWLLLRRELFHQQAVLAFNRLAAAYETMGRDEQAYAVANRLLTLDPYHEETYRQIMRLLARMGQPYQALQQLEQLRQVLREEMGVEPSPETLALAEQLVAGEFDRLALSKVEGMTGGQDDKMTGRQDDQMASGGSHLGAVIRSSPHLVTNMLDLRDVPNPGLFFGRAREQQQLTKWLLHDRSRLVAILGIGGMGKTTLAAQSIRAIATAKNADVFDAIYWRSLVNAPPLAELLPPLLQLLSEQQLVELPTTVDEQLRLLLGYLRARRVLLVLDNMESILEPTHAGAYRLGYESYGQLIQQMATLDHQGILVLTSRERPQGYARWERDGYPVHALQLSGLDDEAGRKLLAQRGLSGVGDEEAMLIARYSGNPLALKLVADTVDELFGGDIREFLSEAALVFDDIRVVLDQQFARLTELEQQILFWLAVTREPISPQALRERLLHKQKQSDFLESLRGLQRRSLLVRQGTDLALQNVVTEYLTDRLVETAVHELTSGQFNLLHRVPLMLAQANEYVRESQARLILAPINRQLHSKQNSSSTAVLLRQILADLRLGNLRLSSYAAGSILNLLKAIREPLAGYNFSDLALWQADLVNLDLHHVDFRGADLSYSTFTQNLGHLYAVAVQPQGDLVAIGTGNGDIHLWQLANLQPEGVLLGHRNRVQWVAFHPHSDLLASASYDGTVRLWHVESGRCLRILDAQSDGVLALDFSPDGTLLATSGIDRTICLWEMSSLLDDTMARVVPLAILKQHTDWVDAVAFAPNGKILASGSEDATICLWDVDAIIRQQATERMQDGKMQAIKPITTLVSSATVSQDERRVLTLAFSPDGSLMASADVSSTVYLWDTQSWQIVHRCQGHTNWIRSLAFTPDGTMLASSGAETVVILWNTMTGQIVDRFHGHTGSVWALDVKTDGSTLFSVGNDGSLRLWNLHNRGEHPALRLVQGNPTAMFAVAFDPAGNTLAASDEKGNIYLWDNPVADPLQCRILTGHTGKVDRIAFSPNGKILASISNDETVRLWDWDNLRCLATLKIEARRSRSQELTSVAFNASGEYLAVGGTDGDIYLWHIQPPEQGQLRAVLRGHTLPIRTLWVSAQQDLLVSGSMDGTIRLWSLSNLIDDQTALPAFQESPSEIWATALDSTGQIVAAGCRDGTIRLWNIYGPSGQPPLTLLKEDEGIQYIAFSPDDRIIASCDLVGNVNFWNVSEEHRYYTLNEHRQQVKSIAFRSDGEIFASGSLDGTIKLWNVRTQQYVATLTPPGPYEGMNITGVTGISAAQRAALKALGAVETVMPPP